MRNRPTRTTLTIIASAVAASTLSMAAVSYAGDAAHAKSAASKNGGAGSVLPGVRGVLKYLVGQGSITQTQADAIQRQADTGTIDPKTLVQSGVITDAQMHLVANGIEEVKLAGR